MPPVPGRASLVPPVFAARVALREGPDGAAWVERLPSIVAEACRRWQLDIDGPSTHGEVALVVPVRRGTERAVLKVSWPHPEAASEAAALAAWDGHGAVRLLAEDPVAWALLLERAHPEQTLASLPDGDAAVVTAASLLEALHIDSPPGLPRLSSLSTRWIDELDADWRRLGRPVDRRLVDEAIATCRQLGDNAWGRLLHGDFHYDNVLAAEREPWLVIDPKPMAGDPAFEVVPLLRNRWHDVVATGNVAAAVRRRFDLVVDVAHLDRDRARAWAVTRAVDDALWGAERSRPEFAAIATTIAETLSPSSG